MGRYSKALEYYKRALNIELKTLGEDHPSTAVTYNEIGQVNIRMGNYSIALDYYERALNIELKKLG